MLIDNTGEQNKKSSLVSGIFQQNLVVYGSHIAKWLVVLLRSEFFAILIFLIFQSSKTKGGTIGWKKIFFQKMSPMLSKIVSNDKKYWAEFRNIYIVWSGPLNGTFSAHVRYTGRARLYSVMHGACTFDSDHFTNDIYIFGISTTFLMIWEYFGQHLGHFLKKIFFSPKGPPFDFWALKNQKNPNCEKLWPDWTKPRLIWL